MSRSRLLPLPLVVALSACVPELPEEKPQEGNTAGDCTDRADNDDDGTFDCEDDGCSASPDCTAAPAAPEGLAVAIEPAAPMDADDLRCAVTTEAVDPNGDTVTYVFAWSVDGADAGLSSDTVGNALTVPGQSWTCTVTASDGTLTGTPATATVTILQANRAPSAPVVAITPGEPTDDDALLCGVVTESSDPDGDAVTYAYSWTVDGVDAGVSVAEVPSSRTAAGESWTCSVTATDGTATSGAGVATVEVAPANCTAVTRGYLQLPELSYDRRTGWTVEYWLRVLGTPSSDVLWRAWPGYDCPDLGSMGLDATLGGAWTHGTPSTPVIVGAVDLATDAHVAVTFHESGTALFIDGMPVGTSTAAGSGTCAAAMLHLASGNVAVASARITEGLRYSTAFSPPVAVAVDTDTLAAFRFEDRAADIAFDASPHGNHATWRSAPSFADDASCR